LFQFPAAWFQPHTITILLCSQLEYSSKKRQNQAKNKNSSQKLPISNYFKQLLAKSTKNQQEKPLRLLFFANFSSQKRKAEAIHHLSMSFFSDA